MELRARGKKAPVEEKHLPEKAPPPPPKKKQKTTAATKLNPEKEPTANEHERPAETEPTAEKTGEEGAGEGADGGDEETESDEGEASEENPVICCDI